jgi:uridylate kinase
MNSTSICSCVHNTCTLFSTLLHTQDGSFSDNDGLASLVAEQMGAQLLVLLTNVDGVYDRAPTEPGARVLHTYLPDTTVEVRHSLPKSLCLAAPVDDSLMTAFTCVAVDLYTTICIVYN